jgi:glycosyltransferase involved in cell wall biosynthesis
LRVGLYNETAGGGLGGAEVAMAVLAEALRREHEVELLHHDPSLTAGRWAEASGTDLGGVRVRHVAHDPERGHYHRNPWRRYQASRSWHAELSRPYDLFATQVHGTPPFCHARVGALVVLFPFETAPHVRPPEEVQSLPRWRRAVERSYLKWEWQRRMASYRVKMSNSNYTAEWTRRRWGVECQTLYPPIESDFREVGKSPLILSVGRFALEGEGHTKKQPEMLAAFRRMHEGGLDGWEYFSVGSLRDSPAHREHFARLREAAGAAPARLVPNIRRGELKDLYERASIFWHAAGYGEDTDARPELAEHFGMSTVEAMAAGCVPVVINKGGQTEIVRHGVNGFLWDTTEELAGYTRLLAGDASLRARMSEAARARARAFSREEFVSRFYELMGPLLRRGS